MNTTNLLASILITLHLQTNWTGHMRGTNELGYVVTNHVAEITYRGQVTITNLKADPSTTAVWRPQKITIFETYTNRSIQPQFSFNQTNFIQTIPTNRIITPN